MGYIAFVKGPPSGYCCYSPRVVVWALNVIFFTGQVMPTSYQPKTRRLRVIGNARKVCRAIVILLLYDVRVCEQNRSSRRSRCTYNVWWWRFFFPPPSGSVKSVFILVNLHTISRMEKLKQYTAPNSHLPSSPFSALPVRLRFYRRTRL